MKTWIVIYMCLSLGLSAEAQLLSPAGLDSVKVFKNLERALRAPDQVYALDLSGNRLKVVPQELKQFTNLNKLILNKNKLKELPPFIAEFEYMQVLRLSNNKLDLFPPEICELEFLDHLDLGKNRIDTLPPCIENLTRLRILDLWGNDLGDFPDEIVACRSLRYIDMRTILLTEGELDRLTALLPWAKIYFDPPCDCDE